MSSINEAIAVRPFVDQRCRNTVSDASIHALIGHAFDRSSIGFRLNFPILNAWVRAPAFSILISGTLIRLGTARRPGEDSAASRRRRVLPAERNPLPHLVPAR